MEDEKLILDNDKNNLKLNLGLTKEQLDNNR